MRFTHGTLPRDIHRDSSRAVNLHRPSHSTWRITRAPKLLNVFIRDLRNYPCYSLSSMSVETGKLMQYISIPLGGLLHNDFEKFSILSKSLRDCSLSKLRRSIIFLINYGSGITIGMNQFPTSFIVIINEIDWRTGAPKRMFSDE